MLVQICYDQRKDVAMYFIDYEKAFDRVQHAKLMDILERMDVDQKDVCCIRNLYWKQKTEVRMEGGNTNHQMIYRGISQGSVFSPLLFNLYSEHIFLEALEDQDVGIKVNDE